MSMHATLPYDPKWQALAWAKEHCPSYITNDVHPNGHHKSYHRGGYLDYEIDYFFSDERDAVLFLLRWS
jgi:hypothetical protein